MLAIVAQTGATNVACTAAKRQGIDARTESDHALEDALKQSENATEKGDDLRRIGDFGFCKSNLTVTDTNEETEAVTLFAV